MSGVGAFFDLDGTLIPRPSLEKRFLRVLRREGAVGLRNYVTWLREATRLLPRGINLVVYGNKAWLRGIGESRADALIIPPFFPRAIEHIVWHAEHGHVIVIISGALEPLAKKAAELLEEELAGRGIAANIEVLATRLEAAAGSWTGRILGEAMFGEAKARAMRRFAAARDVDLKKCFAYGDSTHDRWMLETAGKAVAVNPSSDLARIAMRNDWDILRWNTAETKTESSQRERNEQEEDGWSLRQFRKELNSSGRITGSLRISAAKPGYRP
jgi:HAD superfamily hydrolase (TIGR01490 family)